MTDSGKGKEKAVEADPATATPPTHALASESGTVEPTSAVPTPQHADIPAASTEPREVPASTVYAQGQLPSDTTEGPSASAQQINPHVSAVSLSNNPTLQPENASTAQDGLQSGIWLP